MCNEALFSFSRIQVASVVVFMISFSFPLEIEITKPICGGQAPKEGFVISVVTRNVWMPEEGYVVVYFYGTHEVYRGNTTSIS